MVTLKKLISTLLVMSLASPLGCVEAKEIAKTSQKAHREVFHVCTKQDSTLNSLACTMYSEARSEGSKGMLLVGQTVINRTNSEKFPSRVKSVIFQPDQFSYTLNKNQKVYDKDAWDMATALAKYLLFMEKNYPDLRLLTDGTQGATFYTRHDTKPYWAKFMNITIRYKNHVFYRSKN